MSEPTHGIIAFNPIDFAAQDLEMGSKVGKFYADSSSLVKLLKALNY
jgi:hypothetical protein